MAFAREGTLVGFKNFLDAVTNTPVGTVHVTGHNKHHGQGQVVVCLIGQPERACLRIKTTIKGQEISILTPLQCEEWCQTLSKAREQLSHLAAIKDEFVR